MINFLRLNSLLYGARGTARRKCPKCRSVAPGYRYIERGDLLKVYCHDCAHTWIIAAAVASSTPAPGPTKGKEA